MTNPKDIINWQFVDKYYPFLLEMMKNIRVAFHQEIYEMAFKDMEQIFMQIHREIYQNQDTKKQYYEIENKIKTINELNNKYNLLHINKEMPNHSKLWQMSLLKHQQKQEVSDLYKIITRVISDLNMFFPKITKDNIKAIKQR